MLPLNASPQIPTGPRSFFYPRRGKRIFDLVSLSVAAPLILPLVGIAAALVWLRLGRPVFFEQPRCGRHQLPFTLLKFRTMNDTRDAMGALLPDSKRLTGFGRFLRRTSCDELPQLWNVLRGEMSLVGPRPLLPQYVDRYTSAQRSRHNVLPGITGLAQVSGRNLLTWERRFELDAWYVEHCSFWLDVRILLRTALYVLKADGISPESSSTMPEFMGRTGSQAHCEGESSLCSGPPDSGQPGIQ